MSTSARRSRTHLGYGNSRHATTYTVDGVTDTILGWAKRIGCTYHKLYKRICLQGRSPEDAIRAGAKRLNRTYVTIGGETRTIAEWGRKTGISEDRISERLKRGWTPEEATGMAKRECPKAARITFRGKTRRICEWAKELGIAYDAMRARVLMYKAGRMPKCAVFLPGPIVHWRKMRKVKHQNWYRGRRLTIEEICAMKGCGRTWISTMFKAGFTATQILDNPILSPCRDQAEISRRQAASQKRNRRLRELRQIGLIM